jgi:hypothetical protein
MMTGLPFATGKLIEECGELQAALGKTLRFGWDSWNPESDDRETNERWVEREMLDVENAIINLRRELDNRRK